MVKQKQRRWSEPLDVVQLTDRARPRCSDAQGMLPMLNVPLEESLWPAWGKGRGQTGELPGSETEKAVVEPMES